jgi:hypothetical protein
VFATAETFEDRNKLVQSVVRRAPDEEICLKLARLQVAHPQAKAFVGLVKDICTKCGPANCRD